MVALIKVTVNLTETELKKLDEYISERDYSRSKMIRMLVKHFLFEKGYTETDALPPEGDVW